MFKDEFFAAYNDEHPAGKTDFNRGNKFHTTSFSDDLRAHERTDGV